MKETGYMIQFNRKNHHEEEHRTSFLLDQDQLEYKYIEQEINNILESKCYDYIDFAFENKRNLFVRLTIELFEELVVFQVILGRVGSVSRNEFFLCDTVFKDIFYLTDVTCSYDEIDKVKESLIKSFINISNGLTELDFDKE